MCNKLTWESCWYVCRNFISMHYENFSCAWCENFIGICCRSSIFVSCGKSSLICFMNSICIYCGIFICVYCGNFFCVFYMNLLKEGIFHIYVSFNFICAIKFITGVADDGNRKCKIRKCICINPIVPNTPFFYPLKTSENLTTFWCFKG